MTTRCACLLTVCLAFASVAEAAEAIPPKTHPDSSDWAALTAPDLSDAEFPEGVWTVRDGVLTASEDQCLWTKKEYDNFILDLEFRNASATNSGVIVYCSDVKNWIPNSLEVQIADDHSEKWSKMPRSWQCGAIFGRVPSEAGAVKKPVFWNRMTITCQGPMIYVLLNDQAVAEMDMRKWTSPTKNPDGTPIPPWLSKPAAELATKGRIGLQGKHAGAPIWFRNVKIQVID